MEEKLKFHPYSKPEGATKLILPNENKIYKNEIIIKKN